MSARPKLSAEAPEFVPFAGGGGGEEEGRRLPMEEVLRLRSQVLSLPLRDAVRGRLALEHGADAVFLVGNVRSRRAEDGAARGGRFGGHSRRGSSGRHVRFSGSDEPEAEVEAEESAHVRTPSLGAPAHGVLHAASDPWRPEGAAKGAKKAEKADPCKTARAILNRLTAERFEALASRFVVDVGEQIGQRAGEAVRRRGGGEGGGGGGGGGGVVGETWGSARMEEEAGRARSELVGQVAELVVEKAMQDRTFAVLYARLCFLVDQHGTGAWAGLDPEDPHTSAHSAAPEERKFLSHLLRACQKAMEEDQDMVREEYAALRASDMAEWRDKEAKRRDARITLFRFLGELHRQSVLPQPLAHRCVLFLLDRWHERGVGVSPVERAKVAREEKTKEIEARREERERRRKQAEKEAKEKGGVAGAAGAGGAGGGAGGGGVDWGEEDEVGGVDLMLERAKEVEKEAEAEEIEAAGEEAREEAREETREEDERTLGLEQFLLAAGSRMELAPEKQAKLAFEAYFAIVGTLSQRKGLDLPIRFLLERLLELRASNWQSRRFHDEGASRTRQQIKDDARIAELERSDPGKAALLRAQLQEAEENAAVEEERGGGAGWGGEWASDGWETVDASKAKGRKGGEKKSKRWKGAGEGKEFQWKKGGSGSGGGGGRGGRGGGGGMVEGLESRLSHEVHDGAGEGARKVLDAGKFKALCCELLDEFCSLGLAYRSDAADTVREELLAGVDATEAVERAPKMLIAVQRMLDHALNARDVDATLEALANLWRLLCATPVVGPAESELDEVPVGSRDALLRPQQVVDGLVLHLEFIQDVVVDVPRAPQHFARLLSHCILSHVVSFHALQRAIGAEGAAVATPRDRGTLATILKQTIQHIRDATHPSKEQALRDVRAEIQTILWAPPGEHEALEEEIKALF